MKLVFKNGVIFSLTEERVGEGAKGSPASPLPWTAEGTSYEGWLGELLGPQIAEALRKDGEGNEE